MSDCLHLEQQHSHYLLALDSLYPHTRPLTATFCTYLTHTHTHTYLSPYEHLPFTRLLLFLSILLIQSQFLLLGPASGLLYEQEQVYPALLSMLVVRLICHKRKNAHILHKFVHCSHILSEYRPFLHDRELDVPFYVYSPPIISLSQQELID